MNCLVWNCQGLGLPQTIKEIGILVQKHKPKIMFLFETKKSRDMELLRVRWCFDNCLGVDCAGKSGSIALLRKNEVNLQIVSYSSNHIDSTIDGDSGKWRFTCLYGFQKIGRRDLSWDLLRRSREQFSLP